jgi:hypothetical protein
MELDELYNEFSEYDIKWISLLHQNEDISNGLVSNGRFLRFLLIQNSSLPFP